MSRIRDSAYLYFQNQMEIMMRRNSNAKLLGEFLKRFSLLCFPRIFRRLLLICSDIMCINIWHFLHNCFLHNLLNTCLIWEKCQILSTLKVSCGNSGPNTCFTITQILSSDYLQIHIVKLIISAQGFITIKLSSQEQKKVWNQCDDF